jgi:hypothetical protein
MIARYLPRSLNLLTNESRADKREKLHDETGEQAGGSSSPFFLVNSLSCIHEHEHLFAELAVLSVFQQHGWNGVWADSFGRKYRTAPATSETAGVG